MKPNNGGNYCIKRSGDRSAAPADRLADAAASAVERPRLRMLQREDRGAAGAALLPAMRRRAARLRTQRSAAGIDVYPRTVQAHRAYPDSV